MCRDLPQQNTWDRGMPDSPPEPSEHLLSKEARPLLRGCLWPAYPLTPYTLLTTFVVVPDPTSGAGRTCFPPITIYPAEKRSARQLLLTSLKGRSSILAEGITLADKGLRHSLFKELFNNFQNSSKTFSITLNESQGRKHILHFCTCFLN